MWVSISGVTARHVGLSFCRINVHPQKPKNKYIYRLMTKICARRAYCCHILNSTTRSTVSCLYQRISTQLYQELVFWSYTFKYKYNCSAVTNYGGKCQY